MKISLVVPVLNEQETIPIFYKMVRNFQKLSEYEVEIIFINDGSTDATELVINNLIETDNLITLISFSRNFGKEPALFAGLNYAVGDVVIPIDVDLQDPIEVIPLLIDQYKAGADVVLAKRTDRSSDGFLKRKTAFLFYWLHNKIAATKIEENVGDFRLISHRVVQAIKELPERQLFMKGILSWVGFNTAIVEYKRQSRVAGKTKFNGWKLWNLALEGFTSFSTIPLRVWSYFGGIVASFGFIYAFIIIFKKLLLGNEVSGYASIMSAILLLGGIQLIGIGVIGEYLGRVYMETKARPRYIVKSIKGNHENIKLEKIYDKDSV